MSLSVTQTAFEGFRLIGRRPMSLALWTLAILVFCAAMVALFLVVAWPTLAEFGRLESETLPAADALRLLAPLGLAVAAVVPLSLLMNGVLMAALYRAVLRPEKVGFGYLRLGADELRQVVVALLQFLMAAVFLVVPVVVVVCLGAPHEFRAFAPAHWLAVVLGGVLLLALYVWTGVRLSLAGPMTLALGRVRFFGSWRVTRGRFWPLFGVYLLATVLSVVVYLVGEMIADAVLAGFGGAALVRAEELPDLAAITPTLGAGLAVYGVLLMILSTLQFAIGYAPQAAAYRDLAREGGA